MTARIQDFLNACRNGNENAIAMLIEAGVDIHAQDNDGWNGFHYACANGHANVIAMLIEAGADINAQDNYERNGLDLLHSFTISNTDRLGAISTLINAGITLRSQDLHIDGVQYALDENAAQRALVEQAMIQVDFPQRATQCEDVLDFLFLRL